MENIALAKKLNFITGEEENQATVVIEPLFPGYGMTLGNSLRRVLLSSLPGAAVSGVKVKGAEHEFMSLPDIKEDVLEIVLNIKQLRLKMHSDDEVRLSLNVKGKKIVKASDIEKDSQVEIKNPDLVIANLTDAKSELNLEIIVNTGRGYKLGEGVKRENKELGFIELDSIYSPVTAVTLDVQSARVGKMTNWDKLLIDIKTDGTISPQEAFAEAVKIIVDQYSSFLEKISDDNEVDKKSEDKKEKKEKIEKDAEKDKDK